MPNSGRLRNLQELGDVIISDRRVMKELQKLNQLRKLKIDLYLGKLGKSGISDFCVWLENLSSTLRSLMVKVGVNEYKKMRFLNELKSPPLKLESLTLVGHLGTLPDWISRLGNLVKLTLEYSEIGDDGFIQTLGRLPNLLKLRLVDNAYMGERLCFGAQSGFPGLKELILVNLCNLRSVIFKQGVLQCVASVSMGVWGVESKFEEISGIENLCNLREFRLTTEYDSTTGARVKQAIDAHPNHPRLSIL